MDDVFEIDKFTEQQIDKKQPEKVKQVNFRAPEEMADWIKERSKESNKKQEDFLREMVEEYMLQAAEEQYPNRGVEAAEFKSLLMRLQRMFVASLDLCENTENRVREDFRLQMETKDRAIADYQEQVSVLKEEKKILSEDAAKTKALQVELDAVTEQARKDKNDSADRIAEKDRLISALDGEVLKYKAQAEGYDDLKADRDSLAEQLRDANVQNKEQAKDHEIALERAAREAEKAQEKAVTEAKAAVQEKLDQTKERLVIAEAEAASLRGFKAANDELRETLGEKKAKISMLEDQVAALETRAVSAEQKAVEWLEKNRAQAEQIRELQAQVESMKRAAAAGTDGQTAIDGV